MVQVEHVSKEKSKIWWPRLLENNGTFFALPVYHDFDAKIDGKGFEMAYP